jgi:hypothetical protein
MPRLPIDYSKTIIYKIVSKDVNIKECYVGQTTDFTKRKCQHKSNCNNISSKWYNLHIYQFIREHGGWINFDMIEVEKYNANDILDAHKKERYWIEQLQATLNKLIPSRTIKEYYEQNKDKIKEQQKEYREQNIDKIKEHQKEYYEQNKEHKKEYMKEYQKEHYEQNKEHKKEYMKEYQKEHYEQNKDKIKEQRKEYYNKNKEHKKEYYEQNKEHKKEYIKEYYEQNKDKIKEQHKEYREQNKDKIKEPITCICGSICSKNHLKRHEQTKKHIEFVKTI